MVSKSQTLGEVLGTVDLLNAFSGDLVNPSVQRSADAYLTASAIMWAGASDPGWIAKTGNAYLADVEGMSNTPLNAFDESHSASSLTVTIDTGEGFVGGAWLARDNTTEVKLSSSTNNQSVYVGWNADGTNEVTIGKSGAFSSNDHKIEIWQFDTDASGVTSSSDQRTLGRDLGTYTGTNNTYDSDGDGLIEASNIEDSFLKNDGDTSTGDLLMEAVLDANNTNGRVVLPVGTDKWAN